MHNSESTTNLPERRNPSGYAALTIVFGVVALVGVAFMLSARSSESD